MEDYNTVVLDVRRPIIIVILYLLKVMKSINMQDINWFIPDFSPFIKVIFYYFNIRRTRPSSAGSRMLCVLPPFLCVPSSAGRWSVYYVPLPPTCIPSPAGRWFEYYVPLPCAPWWDETRRQQHDGQQTKKPETRADLPRITNYYLPAAVRSVFLF
jgi:hypothetical protein